MACLEYFGTKIRTEAKEHFQDIFEAVEQRTCDLGIVPLENSVNGSVGQCLDLFTRHGVFARAEWFSRIRQSLMSREQRLDAVRVVYSHAQALGQCAAWLKANLPQARQVPLESTALAARRAAEEGGSAAVAHAGMADSLRLHVLARGIEDLPDNWTRFFVIGPEPPEREPGANKTSIVFTVANRPGSLAGMLHALAASGINLSKLESRPRRGELWQYVFFADLDCDIGKPEYAAALEGVRECCLSLRILGSYPAGRRIR
jgi:chorismate mutase/prephenate dehydratase